MIVDVKVPAVGESVTEGVLARWLKADGEAVREGDLLFELETDKVNSEIPAETGGVLKHGAKEGETIAVGASVGSIDTEGAAAAAPKAAKVAKTTENGEGAAAAEGAEGAREERVAISPVARRIAKETGADVAAVRGSGPGGKIMKKDVLGAGSARAETAPKTPASATATAKPSPSSAPTKPPFPIPARAHAGDRRESREQMSQLRLRIAQRLVESQQTTATLTTFNEADMSEVMAMRRRLKDTFKEKHGVGLGFMSFFVKAAVDALKLYPAVNARIDGRDIVHHHYYDIGVAVSTERGLVVPVIRDADRLSFAEIEATIADFGERARTNKLALDELQGGTFTITNGGIFGSLMATPIINPPQSGILGMHGIKERPVVVDGQIVARPMMYIALSYDHRLIDGRESVGFLMRIKECIEHPERMMLGV